MDIKVPKLDTLPTEKQYSGTIFVRGPKTLHQKLDEMAEREGVSLNHLVVYILSRVVGLNDSE